MNEKINNGNFKNGSVNISEDVITVISNIAAHEVEGVAEMSKGITAEISKMFGIKNAAKGTSVEIDGNDVHIDIFIAIEYGIKINDLSREIQKNVKETVETMTGLNVTGVNISVQEVVFKKEDTSEIEE